MKKIINKMIIIAIVIILCFSFTGCNKNTEDQVGTTNTHKDTTEEAIEEMDIETSFGTLKFPAKWKEQIRIEIEDESECTIRFYGTVEGKEEQHLFNISFGGEGDIPIGSIIMDGVGYDVCMTFAELDIEDWNEEDANTLFAMQEDVNYIIKCLEKNSNFEKAE